MTERSMFWSDGLGDGGPYTQDQLRLLYDALAGSEDADRGVLVTQGNELAPSSTGNNNIRMATGRGVVDGTLYENDAILDIVTASPVGGVTGRRLVLQKDWTTRTVRAVIISSADGVAGIPALTQNDGTIWEIPICSFTITVGGVIGALTDQREFCEGTDSRGVTILDRDLSQVDIANDAVERTIYSHTIPARALAITGGFKLTLGGDALVNAGAGDTIMFKIKLGATTVLTSIALNITNSAARYKWQWDIFCMNVAAGSQKWVTMLHGVAATENFSLQLGGIDAGSASAFHGIGYNTSAEDTTGALLLDITVDWSVANANNSWRKEMALLELIPAV